jgi:hypothetical protein
MVLAPGLGSVSRGSPDPLCGYTSRLRLFGECCLVRFVGFGSWGEELDFGMT